MFLGFRGCISTRGFSGGSRVSFGASKHSGFRSGQTSSTSRNKYSIRSCYSWSTFTSKSKQPPSFLGGLLTYAKSFGFLCRKKDDEWYQKTYLA